MQTKRASTRWTAFLWGLGVCLALAAGPPAQAQVAPVAQTPLSGVLVPKFVQPLPQLYVPALGQAGPGIPVALGSQVTVSMCEFKNQILPAGSTGRLRPSPLTSVWGYRVGAACPGPNTLVGDSYIGPVIVAEKGKPTAVTYVNQLGTTATTNVLAYKQSTDQTLMWADPLGYLGGGLAEANHCAEALMTLPAGSPPPPGCEQNYAGPIAAAPHLHGGEIPAMLDGGPDAWWTSTGLYGHGYYSQGGFADAAAGKATYVYPNVQDAAPIWFHDHVLGATRLNVYAGIAGAYMITDPDPGKTVLDQSSKLATGLLPLGLDTNGNGTTDPAGDELLVPVVLQDRMYDTTGQLFFPAVGINPEHPYWIPEFVGDTIVINGKAWPFLNVAPKRYRFLFLNGSNARSYELYLLNRTTGVKGPSLWVIGNDQGYLDAPAQINPAAPTNNKLVIMPGERYEVVVDFTGAAGATLELVNTGRTPYPGGAPVSGSTTARILQIRVTKPAPAGGDRSYNPAGGGSVRAANPIVRLANPATGTPANTPAGTPVAVQKVRRLTLNEFLGAGGPMEILVNNTKYLGNIGPTGLINPATGLRTDFTPITTQWNTTYYSELPNEGETELWEIVNITADAHPIHPHLVAFQILNRQAFDAVAYTTAYDGLFPGGGMDQATGLPYPPGFYMPGYGPPLDYNCGNPTNAARGFLDPAVCVLGGNPDPAPFFLGAARPPLPTEAGWKDTAISYPGEVLRMLVRFAPGHLPNDTLADNAWYDFSPNGGHGYVWHCHIIDHEDNEMMRPYSVVANPSPNVARTFVMGTNF